MLFSLSGWRSGLLLRNFSSSLLRDIPEKGSIKICSSHRAWSPQRASLPRLLRLLLPPTEKKSLQNISSSLKRKVQDEPGKLSWKSQLLFLTLKWRTLKGEHHRIDFFYYLFSDATLKELGKWRLNQAEKVGTDILKWQWSFLIATAAVPAKPGQQSSQHDAY